MSLLMEALRKAEEAKSKAAKEDRENDQPRDVPTDTPEESPALTLDTTPEAPVQDEGPVIINPDPDEEETLAAHASEPDLPVPEADADVADLGDLTIDDLTFGHHDEEIEQIEFTATPRHDVEDTPPEPEPASPPISAGDAADDDDDSLSLLRSGYFSRSKKPLSKRNALDDFDPHADTDDEADARADTPTPLENPDTAVGQTPDTPDDQHLAPPTDEPVEPARQENAEKAREQEQRNSAGALFLAKQDSQKRRLRKLTGIAAVIALFPLAGGIYWFYTEMTSTSQMQFNIASGGNQVQNRFLGDGLQSPAAETGVVDRQAAEASGSGQALATDATAGTTAEPALPAPASGSNTQTPVAPTPAETSAAPPVPAINNPQVSQAGNTPVGSTRDPAPAAPVQQEQPQQAQTITVAQTNNPAVQQTSGGLNFVKTEFKSVINPDLNTAFDSYQQGDLANASRLYQQVLASEPTSRDAMLGLASVYLKQSNVSMAQNLYARLLELNPRDPLARAGLLDTIQGDPVRQEAELKSLISAYPNTAPLSYALGNLYASQNRWNDAQTVYFDALLSARSANAGPISPDYAFNLAVSLERINQLRPALEYYREAAAFARNVSPGFDPAQLEQRIIFLEQQLP